MLGRKRPLLRTHDIHTEAAAINLGSIASYTVHSVQGTPPLFHPTTSTLKLSQTTQIWYGGEARWLDFTT